jgi:hypothetical protein
MCRQNGPGFNRGQSVAARSLVSRGFRLAAWSACGHAVGIWTAGCSASGPIRIAPSGDGDGCLTRCRARIARLRRSNDGVPGNTSFGIGTWSARLLGKRACGQKCRTQHGYRKYFHSTSPFCSTQRGNAQECGKSPNGSSFRSKFLGRERELRPHPALMNSAPSRCRTMLGQERPSGTEPLTGVIVERTLEHARAGATDPEQLCSTTPGHRMPRTVNGSGESTTAIQTAAGNNALP